MFESIIGGLFILIAIYALSSLSGLFAERSGTINLSINGGMIMGAAGYIMTSKLLVDQVGDLKWWIPMIGIIVGMIFSLLIISLLSIAAINFRGEHVIIGTAINILAPIISLIIIISISGGQHFIPTTSYQLITVFTSSNLPSWVIQLIVMISVAMLVVILFYVMRFTSFGLRLRAAGENPHALAAAGVSVFKIRHLAMLISGALSGLAGAIAVSGFIKFSSYTSTIFGMGYIALAIMILGQWRMQWLMLGAILFSAIYILAYVYGPELDEKQWYIYMVPYAVILITLPFFSRKSKTPKAEGIPYINTGR